MIEDAYFGNTQIMNSLLDEHFDELCGLACENDKIIFVLAKDTNFKLPHRAHSKMFIMNCCLTYREVIVLMTTQFNKCTRKKEVATLANLVESEEKLREEISELR